MASVREIRRRIRSVKNIAQITRAMQMIAASRMRRAQEQALVSRPYGSELDQHYKKNAERILLQSVAASVMSAHLAAVALGYAVWWVTAIGQEAIQEEYKPLLGVPDDLTILDIMCFGPPLKPSYKRWKKELPEIMNWDTFNMDNYWSEEEIAEWVKTKRHRVMYRDAENVD